MSQFDLIEVKSNDGSKDYYIEGYISTLNPDFANDIVDEKGQQSVYNELQGSDITMDEDHEEWRDPETGKLYDGKKNKYPIAKIVDSRLDDKGTWVSAKLNKYHPNFEERLLPMVKEGYLHSFSIAYNVTNKFFKMLDGVKYRVIQGLKIANVAITGNPVNKNATFNVALKSYKKMVEETQFEEIKKFNQELKSEIQSLSSQISELKSEDYKAMYTKLKADYDKMSAEMEKIKKGDEDKEDSKEMKSQNEEELAEIKSTIEKLEQENAELKSILEAPQLKSTVEAKSKEPTANTQRVSMMEVL